jgi:hypothetical protein
VAEYKRYYVGIPVLVVERPEEDHEVRSVVDDDSHRVQHAKILRIPVEATGVDHAAHILWERIDAVLGDP